MMIDALTRPLVAMEHLDNFRRTIPYLAHEAAIAELIEVALQREKLLKGLQMTFLSHDARLFGSSVKQEGRQFSPHAVHTESDVDIAVVVTDESFQQWAAIYSDGEVRPPFYMSYKDGYKQVPVYKWIETSYAVVEEIFHHYEKQLIKVPEWSSPTKTERYVKAAEVLGLDTYMLEGVLDTNKLDIFLFPESFVYGDAKIPGWDTTFDGRCFKDEVLSTWVPLIRLPYEPDTFVQERYNELTGAHESDE